MELFGPDPHVENRLMEFSDLNVEQHADCGAKKIGVDDDGQHELNPKIRTIRPTTVQTSSEEVDMIDDDYKWKKYGLKVLSGISHPRHYYKCATKSCGARKLNWRDDADLSTLITIYEGVHNHDVPGDHTACGDNSQQGFELELTELPTVEEWEVLILMHWKNSQLFQLPENPRCPILEDLSLNGNGKLRVIPPLFFDGMPSLHALDLSKTRIKSLPDSLFGLTTLKRLFLRHCTLLVKLSAKVGQLKHLQILDLEGTEIRILPEEVKELENLICLKVWFCELSYRRGEERDLMISPGTLGALTLLEELSIHVTPDDGRWNECVEQVVSEVSGLQRLDKLEFFFPSVEFLNHFDWCRFTAFKIVAGNVTAKRLMPRLSSDEEAKLETYDKCLTYALGDCACDEISAALKSSANALFLDRPTSVQTLSSSWFENFLNLQCCVVGECVELEEVCFETPTPSSVSLEYMCLYYMKNLTSIRMSHLGPLRHLKSLTLRTCPMLSSIFTHGTSLECLEEIIIDDCPAIVNLFSSSDDACNNFLPRLKRISLRYLPLLNGIFDLSLSPDLKWMSICCCPNLKSLPINKASNENLKKITGERRWWESLEWKDKEQDSWDDVFAEEKLWC